MPTKRKLPKSSLVSSAYVHCFELRRNGVSVLISFHVQVRKYEQLLTTTKWRMTPLASKSGTVHFTLTPVSKSTVVEIMALDLSIDPDIPKQVGIVFKTPAMVHAHGAVRKQSATRVMRRSHTAGAEAESAAA